jgi:hypothetical protein
MADTWKTAGEWFAALYPLWIVAGACWIASRPWRSLGERV